MTAPDVVFVIVRTSIGHVYGGEKSTIASARALAAQGFEVAFLVTAEDDFVGELEAAGLRYEVVDVGDPLEGLRGASWTGRARKLLGLWRANAAIARMCAGRAGTIVHAAGIPGVLASCFGAKLARGWSIYHMRTGSRVGRTRLRDELIVLLADRTITVSRSLRDELLDVPHRFLLPLLEPRVVPIYNGFDFGEIDRFIAEHSVAECRERTGIDAGRTAIAFVGGVFVDKGQLRFIEEVLPDVVRAVPDVLVTCIGGVKDPAYLAACEAAVARANLQEHIRFLGYQPLLEVYAHYRASDLAVLPSEREGLPRCAVEAQAFHLPVVASAVVGTTEAVQHGVTGHLVPNDRIAEMVEPIVRMARDPALRRRAGGAGAAHVRSSFSLDRNASEIARLYRSLRESNGIAS